MNLRQYTAISALGFLVTLGFPSLKVDELLLQSGGEIVISPAAGITAWPGFEPITSNMLYSAVERHGKAVAFKLAVDNELYVINADCGAVTAVRPDPELKLDLSKALFAADWICKTHAS